MVSALAANISKGDMASREVPALCTLEGARAYQQKIVSGPITRANYIPALKIFDI